MSHQRPNHRRRRKKYAIVEPHEPRLIHHISTITNERRNKGGKEYSSPRRSKTRNGSSASKIVEKESKEKLSRVVCISRLSKANKLNHKCMHWFILFCIFLLAYTNNLSLFYLRLWMFHVVSSKLTQILIYVTIYPISHIKHI